MCRSLESDDRVGFLVHVFLVQLLLPPAAAVADAVESVGFSGLDSFLLHHLSVVQDFQAWDLTDHIQSVVFILRQTSSVEVTRSRLIVHHTQDFDVGKLLADLLHEHGQVVDLVLVDAQRGDRVHEGELHMGRVAVTVQDQGAEFLQATQESRVSSSRL